MSPASSIHHFRDINGDRKIGVAEGHYALQVFAGLRNPVEKAIHNVSSLEELYSAVEGVCAGDTILLAQGLYELQDDRSWAGLTGQAGLFIDKNLTLAGSGNKGESETRITTGSGIVIDSAASVTLRDLRLEDTGGGFIHVWNVKRFTLINVLARSESDAWASILWYYPKEGGTHYVDIQGSELLCQCGPGSIGIWLDNKPDYQPDFEVNIQGSQVSVGDKYGLLYNTTFPGTAPPELKDAGNVSFNVDYCTNFSGNTINVAERAYTWESGGQQIENKEKCPE
jgi:hypothetical protein